MRRLVAVALVVLPAAAWGEDYFGVLRVPPASTSGAYYSFASISSLGFNRNANDSSQRLRLGYKYSRFFSVEGEFSDYARPSNPFVSPTSLQSPFRSTGFGLDTVAMLPVWGFSFYGRMGAYRGDRNGPITLAGMLPFEAGNRGTRWRYGLGLRYDFTRSLGVQAELERHSNTLGSPLAGDMDTDQVTVGVSWRF